MYTVLEYKIQSSLKGALIVALDIMNETDLQPEFVTTHDGAELNFNAIDAAKVQYGVINEAQYIESNNKQ